MFDKTSIDSEYRWALLSANDAFHSVTDKYFPERYSMIKRPNPFKENEELYTTLSMPFCGCIKQLGVYWEKKDNFTSEQEWLTAVKEYEIARIRFIYDYLNENYENDDFYFDFLYRDIVYSYWYRKLDLTIKDILEYKYG